MQSRSMFEDEATVMRIMRPVSTRRSGRTGRASRLPPALLAVGLVVGGGRVADGLREGSHTLRRSIEAANEVEPSFGDGDFNAAIRAAAERAEERRRSNKALLSRGASHHHPLDHGDEDHDDFERWSGASVSSASSSFPSVSSALPEGCEQGVVDQSLLHFQNKSPEFRSAVQALIVNSCRCGADHLAKMRSLLTRMSLDRVKSLARELKGSQITGVSSNCAQFRFKAKIAFEQQQLDLLYPLSSPSDTDEDDSEYSVALEQFESASCDNGWIGGLADQAVREAGAKEPSTVVSILQDNCQCGERAVETMASILSKMRPENMDCVAGEVQRLRHLHAEDHLSGADCLEASAFATDVLIGQLGGQSEDLERSPQGDDSSSWCRTLREQGAAFRNSIV